jgi:hypothetical protein
LSEADRHARQLAHPQVSPRRCRYAVGRGVITGDLSLERLAEAIKATAGGG